MATFVRINNSPWHKLITAENVEEAKGQEAELQCEAAVRFGTASGLKGFLKGMGYTPEYVNPKPGVTYLVNERGGYFTLEEGHTITHKMESEDYPKVY